MKYIFTLLSLLTLSGSLLAMHHAEPNAASIQESMNYLKNMNRLQFVQNVRPLLDFHHDDERSADFYGKHLGAIYNAAQKGDIAAFKHHLKSLMPQVE